MARTGEHGLRDRPPRAPGTPVADKLPGDTAMPEQELRGMNQVKLKKFCSERSILQKGVKADMLRRALNYEDKHFGRILSVPAEEADADSKVIQLTVNELMQDDSFNISDRADALAKVEGWIEDHRLNDDEEGQLNYSVCRRLALGVEEWKTSVAPAPAGAADTAKWDMNANFRLVCCMAEPSVRAALARLCEGNGKKADKTTAGGDRQEYEDAGPWASILAHFMDKGFEPDISDWLAEMSGCSFDPTKPPEGVVTTTMIKAKWSALKSSLATPMQNWEVSGEGEVDRFGSFTDSPVLQFMFQKLQQEPSLMAFATRKLEDESTAEEGAPVAQAQAQPRGRGRKRSGSTGGRTGSPAPVEGGNALTQEENSSHRRRQKKYGRSAWDYTFKIKTSWRRKLQANSTKRL